MTLSSRARRLQIVEGIVFSGLNTSFRAMLDLVTIGAQRVKAFVGSVSNQPYFIEGKVPFPIDRLVSPLRYDILVRAEYFRFFAASRSLFHRDFEQYVLQALDHPYFIWFKEVACARFQPHLLDDPHSLLEAYKIRIRRSAELYVRFEQKGMDNRFPIRLNSGRTIEGTLTGKDLNSRIYAGNGCHRIALLILSGFTCLPAQSYRIKIQPVYRPIDNTYSLLRPLGLTSVEYFGFLSKAYADKSFTDKEALLQHISRHNPDHLREVESIIRIDQERMTGIWKDPQPLNQK